MAYDVNKLLKVGQAQTIVTRLNNEIKVKGVKVNGSKLTPDASRDVDVTIELTKLATATAGYAHSYKLTVNGTDLAQTIDIPKDFLVKSSEVKTVTTADTPVQGYTVGQKYIDFTVNSIDNDDTASHMYILIDDMIQALKAGNGINVASDNTISINLDNTGVGGLTVGANGLKLEAVTADTYTGETKTADGVAGAMSSADKYKLDNVSTGANKVTVTTPGSGAIEIDGVSAAVVEIATDAEITEMLNTVLGAA